MSSHFRHCLVGVCVVAQLAITATSNAETRVLDAPVGILVASNAPTSAPQAAPQQAVSKPAATPAAHSLTPTHATTTAKPVSAKPASVAAPGTAVPVAHKVTVSKSELVARAAAQKPVVAKKPAIHKHHARSHARHRSATRARVEPHRDFWSAPHEFDVLAGTQQRYTHNRPIKQVAVGNDKVATFTVVSGHTVLINALQPGVTTLMVWSNPNSARPDVEARLVVTPNIELEKSALAGEGVRVDAPLNKLRLSGSLTSLGQHDTLLQAASTNTQQGDKQADKSGSGASSTIDNTVSGFESQVQIDIKIVEIDRTKLMRSNIFLAKSSNNTTVGTSGSGGIAANNLVLNLVSSITSAALVVGNASKGLAAQFDILESNGFAYTIAEPSLVALSGQTATFLAGGEIPIPVGVSSSNGQNTISIQFKEFGVKLALSPTVLDAQRIFLKVAPEVSELDPANGVTLAGTQIPGLRVRRTDTTVALGDGESFVISGLVSRDTLANAKKIPGLGNLPIIGAFFKANDFSRNDRELVMIVTPHIVKPLAANATLPPLPGARFHDYNPDFSDLLFKESGKFELPAGGFSK
jgi:pilus assembly protein CpaC